MIAAAVIVRLALLSTGTLAALPAGGSPVKMAWHQLAIGYVALYALGPLFGTTVTRAPGSSGDA